MLILTRKIGERIIIGDDVSIVVLDTYDDRIKLGVKAPKDVAVNREEVYDKIQAEKRAQANKGKQNG